MILEEKYTLSNGALIPKLGLGTWFINNENAVQAVKDAAQIEHYGDASRFPVFGRGK